VYSLDPTFDLNEEQKKHIIGAQANLWTEYITTTEHVEYMVLPPYGRPCRSTMDATRKERFQRFH